MELLGLRRRHQGRDEVNAIRRGAHFSGPGFRTSLLRVWDEGKETGAFIGLNPGMANGDVDDMTATKMVGFAKRWGWGAYIAYNLFEYVATDPSELVARIRAGHEVGVNPIEAMDLINHSTVCLAWGNPIPKIKMECEVRIALILKFLTCSAWRCRTIVAGTTKGGHPSHLSRLPYVDSPWVVSPAKYPFIKPVKKAAAFRA
ncbi:hypothetical protein LCGC14_0319930 [marine sediment metagenome]|uniref:DUF1643 domain-containing protein n=1 Tax=marine sediment metagenome TaxID=412755 RepID=A0A0F9TJK0_9ZZZZ